MRIVTDEKPSYEIRVALIGHVSAGKTTLLNALLQDKYSEVAANRTTASVGYFRIHHHDSTTDELDSPQASVRSAESILEEIVQDNGQGEATTDATEKHYDIYLKEPLFEMRKDTKLVLVDVPGINQAGSGGKYERYLASHWKTFDAIVVVMDAKQGVNSESSINLLRFVKRNNTLFRKSTPTILVFNKVDDPDDVEQAGLVREAKQEVQKIFSSTAVFSLGSPSSSSKKNAPKRSPWNPTLFSSGVAPATSANPFAMFGPPAQNQSPKFHFGAADTVRTRNTQPASGKGFGSSGDSKGRSFCQPPAELKASDEPDYREILTTFFAEHNPAKLSCVDEFLTKFKGHERELVGKLAKKYKAPSLLDKLMKVPVASQSDQSSSRSHFAESSEKKPYGRSLGIGSGVQKLAPFGQSNDGAKGGSDSSWSLSAKPIEQIEFQSKRSLESAPAGFQQFRGQQRNDGNVQIESMTTIEGCEEMRLPESQNRLASSNDHENPSSPGGGVKLVAEDQPSASQNKAFNFGVQPLPTFAGGFKFSSGGGGNPGFFPPQVLHNPFSSSQELPRIDAGGHAAASTFVFGGACGKKVKEEANNDGSVAAKISQRKTGVSAIPVDDTAGHETEALPAGCLQERSDPAKRTKTVPATLSNTMPVPRMLAMSAQNAFILQVATKMDFDRFLDFDKDMVERIGREQLGLRRWKNLSEEDKYKETFDFLCDDEEMKLGLQRCNFKAFLEVLVDAVGGIEKQTKILSERLKGDLSTIAPYGIMNQLVELRNKQLDFLGSDVGEVVHCLSVDDFWHTFENNRAIYKSAKEQIKELLLLVENAGKLGTTTKAIENRVISVAKAIINGAMCSIMKNIDVIWASDGVLQTKYKQTVSSNGIMLFLELILSAMQNPCIVEHFATTKILLDRQLDTTRRLHDGREFHKWACSECRSRTEERVAETRVRAASWACEKCKISFTTAKNNIETTQPLHFVPSKKEESGNSIDDVLKLKYSCDEDKWVPMYPDAFENHVVFWADGKKQDFCKVLDRPEDECHPGHLFWLCERIFKKLANGSASEE